MGIASYPIRFRVQFRSFGDHIAGGKDSRGESLILNLFQYEGITMVNAIGSSTTSRTPRALPSHKRSMGNDKRAN